MNKRQSHGTRIFDCEKEGRDLCDWLNENQKLSCGKRVATLIENISKGWPKCGYGDLGMIGRVAFVAGRTVTEKIRLIDLPIRIRPDVSALAKVESELKRHKMRPVIMGRAAVPRYKQKNIKPQMHTEFLWTWDYGKDPATRPVHLLMQLCEADYFDRIRNCKKCTIWFFARFRHQLFCSQKCQIDHYRRTDKFKAHHRDYTRTLRRRKRQGK